MPIYKNKTKKLMADSSKLVCEICGRTKCDCGSFEKELELTTQEVTLFASIVALIFGQNLVDDCTVVRDIKKK